MDFSSSLSRQEVQSSELRVSEVSGSGERCRSGSDRYLDPLCYR